MKRKRKGLFASLSQEELERRVVEDFEKHGPQRVSDCVRRLGRLPKNNPPTKGASNAGYLRVLGIVARRARKGLMKTVTEGYAVADQEAPTTAGRVVVPAPSAHDRLAAALERIADALEHANEMPR